MIPLKDLLKVAEVRHKRGQFQIEQQLLRQIMAQVDDNEDLIYLLGRNLIKLGQYDLALEKLAMVAHSKYEDPGFLGILGEAYLKNDRTEDALNCLSRAESLEPNETSIKRILSIVHCKLGKYDAAIVLARNAVELERANPQNYTNLGDILWEVGRSTEALTAYENSLKIDPDNWEVLRDQGNIYLSLGLFAEAVTKYILANMLNPLCPEVCLPLCSVLIELSRFEEAENLIRSLGSIIPESAVVENCLGGIDYKKGNPTGAVAHYIKALSIDSGNKDTVIRLSKALVQEGKTKNAIALCSQYIDRNQHREELKNLRGRLRMSEGEYIGGLKDINWVSCKDTNRDDISVGNVLEEKRVLITTNLNLEEFGLFLRFLPVLKSRGFRVIVQVTTPFRGLVSGMNCVEDVCDIQDPLPEHEYIMQIEQIPVFLDLSSKELFKNEKLAIDNALKETMKLKLASIPDPKVGLMWRRENDVEGSPYHSVPFVFFRKLFSLENISFVSLQSMLGSEEIQKDVHKGKLFQIGLENASFDERLACIANLNLLISVDTITAQLASCADLPVWSLLSTVPSWYFARNKPVSPWLPSIRQFRKKTPGDWKYPIQIVHDELQKKLAPS